MKKEEAEKVIEIFLECDGGYEYYVSTPLKLFIEKFPEYQGLAELSFKNKFNKNLTNYLNPPT